VVWQPVDVCAGQAPELLLHLWHPHYLLANFRATCAWVRVLLFRGFICTTISLSAQLHASSRCDPSLIAAVSSGRLRSAPSPTTTAAAKVDNPSPCAAPRRAFRKRESPEPRAHCRISACRQQSSSRDTNVRLSSPPLRSTAETTIIAQTSRFGHLQRSLAQPPNTTSWMLPS
jgi:hypothetical protein